MRAIRDEMETIAAANVMRMRRSKRQYIGGWGMRSLPVEPARASERRRSGFYKGKTKNDECAWRQKRGGSETPLLPSRSCTIDHYVKALSKPD